MADSSDNPLHDFVKALARRQARIDAEASSERREGVIVKNTGNIPMRASGATTSDLICPRCGGDYLAQGRIDIFNRGEDAETLTHIRVSGAEASVKTARSSEVPNPSSRRWGMSIRFDCEACSTGEAGDVIELTIAQHKGQTEMGWRYTEKQP